MWGLEAFSFFQMCWLRQVCLTSGSSNDSRCCLCLCLNSTVEPVWVSEVPVSCLVMVALYTRFVIVHLSGNAQSGLSFVWQLHLILNALLGCCSSRCFCKILLLCLETKLCMLFVVLYDNFKVFLLHTL